MLPDNLGYLFDTALALTPSKPAVFQGETVLTYADLDARTNRMANALAALGVTAGDRVALLFNNDFRFLETLFGAMRLGAVAVPLNIRMGDEALRYVAEDSEATVLVANAALADRGRMLAAQIPAIKHVDPDGPAWTRAGLRDRAGRRRAQLARRATAFDETSCSPTLLAPRQAKGVLLTHGWAALNANPRKALPADDTEAPCRGPLYTRTRGGRVEAVPARGLAGELPGLTRSISAPSPLPFYLSPRAREYQ